MGRIKPNNYTLNDYLVSALGDAIGHPARKRIVALVKENKNLTNTKLSKLLNLSKPAVMDHLFKLHNANIVTYNYQVPEFKIKLNENGLNDLEKFIEEIKS
jgi:DNA-binding transcriptional ArsR family regulator